MGCSRQCVFFFLSFYHWKKDCSQWAVFLRFLTFPNIGSANHHNSGQNTVNWLADGSRYPDFPGFWPRSRVPKWYKNFPMLGNHAIPNVLRGDDHMTPTPHSVAVFLTSVSLKFGDWRSSTETVVHLPLPSALAEYPQVLLST